MSIKERLKKIGPIELFIIITVAFLTVFVVKFFGIKEETLTIRVEVIRKNWSENYDPYGYRAPFWLSDKIKTGFTEKDKAGKTIATLINLENYERSGEEAEIYLTLTVAATLNKRTGTYIFKDKPLNLGSAIELNLNNINLVGQIIDNQVPINGYPSQEFLVTAIGRNLDPWIYDKIKPELKVYNRANNEIVAEIKKVKLFDSSEKKFNIDTPDGRIRSYEQKNKDAVIEVKLRANQIDGKWFFTGHQNLKTPNKLYLNFNEVNLDDLEIQEIKDLN